jgi:hypothetical protein
MYAGQKVDFATIVSKVLSVSGFIKKALKKVPVIDAQVFDFADQGVAWEAWRHMEFVGVNGLPVQKHAWWWLKQSWMWGNTKTGGVHFVKLSINRIINAGLARLAKKVCSRVELGNVLIDVLCGLSEAPKAPFRQLAGIQKKFGAPERCQPKKKWKLLKDHNKDKNVPRQCKDGPERTHGKKDTNLMKKLENGIKNGAKAVASSVKNKGKSVAKKLKFW